MRVPTFQTARDGFAAVESRQAEITRLQGQVSSGVRVQRPSDDPLAAAQAERARSHATQARQQQRTAQLAASLLATADGALASGVDGLQRARELLVSAGNAAYGPQDRQALAQELRGIREQLLRLANVEDGAGGFVFGGQGAGGPPMSGGSAPGFQPAAGTQGIGDGGRMAATVDGRATFVDIPQGNGVFVTSSGAANTGTGWVDTGTVADPRQLTGHAYSITVTGSAAAPTLDVVDTTTGAAVATGLAYTDGGDLVFDGQRVKISGTPATGDTFVVAPAARQSVFATLDQAVALLEGPALPSGAYAEKLQRVQVGLDRALDAMSLMRSRVGGQMNAVDTEQATAQQDSLAADERRSDLRDTDMAQSISELQTAQTGLEAALKTYSLTGSKSLFQLLG